MPTAITFNLEDLKTPDRLERVLRQFERELGRTSAAPPSATTAGAATAVSAATAAALGTPSSPPPGTPTSVPLVSEDTHANRLANYPTPSTIGSQFFETDRTVLYVANTSLAWQYSAGAYVAAIASQPSDLGTNDAGFRFIASDTEQHYRWSGSAWVDEIQTSYTLLRWGGTTSSFPAWKRSSANLRARLADDSADTSVETRSVLVLGSTSGSVTIAVPAAAGSNTLTLPAGTTNLSATGGTSQVLRQSSAGAAITVSQLASTDLSDVASGIYTPTLTNVANLDASTAYSCQYIRVGSVVTVSGRVDVNPTLTATATQLGISLPIASNLANANECAGAASASAIAGQCAAILGDATNDRAEMDWVSTDVTSQPMFFGFTYRII